MTHSFELELTEENWTALRDAPRAELVFSGIDQDGPSYDAAVEVDGVAAGSFFVYAHGGDGPRSEPGIERRLGIDPALLASPRVTVTVAATSRGGALREPLVTGVRLVV